MMAGMAGAGDDGTVDPVFVALFEEHYESLVRLARLLVDDRGSGEEIVQDAFVRVWRRWARIDDPVRYMPRRPVVNGARSRLRHRAVIRRYVAADGACRPGGRGRGGATHRTRRGDGRGTPPPPSSA